MNRLRFAVLAVVCALSLGLSAPIPVAHSATPAPVVGEHIVQKGETLYCLGRGYGVVPSAIAAANGLSANARLSIGQVLLIPAVQWVSIPPGPVCVPQFSSPFPSLYTGAPVSATSAPTSPLATASPTPVVSSVVTVGRTYTVQRGDTLYRLGLRFGVTVGALKAANGLVGNTIYVGQVLVIPGAGTSVTPPQPSGNCDPSYPDVCLRIGIGDYDCADGSGDGPNYVRGPIRVLAPDPFGLDDDGDGIGCET